VELIPKKRVEITDAVSTALYAPSPQCCNGLTWREHSCVTVLQPQSYFLFRQFRPIHRRASQSQVWRYELKGTFDYQQTGFSLVRVAY